MEWKYSQPVNIIFGNNILNTLFDILNKLNFKNGLLVCDPMFIQSGLADRVLQISRSLLTKVFSDITPNPTVNSVDTCAAMIKSNNIEFIVALGGGSSLDCAKAAASVCVTPYSIVEFHTGERKFGSEHLPLIAIPTTSGTGSEVTSVSVLSNPNLGIKAPIACNNFYPDYAIIDPVLTLTVPPKITASTGLDVLSHALEGFWSKNHQPICDAMALHAARLVFEYLIKVYDDGSNLKYRGKMSEASLIAGLAFGLPKTAGSHACSFPLTNLYHIPHGEACAFTLDAFTRINAEVENGRLNIFASQLGFINANEMADKIFEMKKYMVLKTTLSDAGIKDDDLENLVALSKHPNMQNNPVQMDNDKILQMYESLR